MELPAEKRQRVEPAMRLIAYANRIRMVNKALGTNLIDLDSLPVDFVAAVVAWSGKLPNG